MNYDQLQARNAWFEECNIRANKREVGEFSAAEAVELVGFWRAGWTPAQAETQLYLRACQD